MGNIRLCYSLLFPVPALRPGYSQCAAYADMFGGSYLFWPCFTAASLGATIFSAARGYIAAPCHNMQANTPTQNVVALYEAVRQSA